MKERKGTTFPISGEERIIRALTDYCQINMISRSRLVIKLIDLFLEKNIDGWIAVDTQSKKEGKEGNDGKKQNISTNIRY